nr:glycerophosphodiester phosphodiesterase family protein [uncultured Cellulosilyticum sp.]
MVLNIAHHGASVYARENTMEAFEKAIQLGADGIKTDVQLSSDGVMVLIHDEQLGRVVEGNGWVKNHSFLELKRLGVPSLEELLTLSKKNNLFLNLELKNSLAHYEGLEEKIIDTLYRYDMMEQVVLSSFNHYSLVKCKQIDNSARTAILCGQPLYRVERYCSYVGANGIHASYKNITKEMVTQANKADLAISAYTVDDEMEMKRLIKLGVDMIITNYPDKLKEVIKKRERKTS